MDVKYFQGIGWKLEIVGFLPEKFKEVLAIYMSNEGGCKNKYNILHAMINANP